MTIQLTTTIIPTTCPAIPAIGALFYDAYSQKLMSYTGSYWLELTSSGGEQLETPKQLRKCDYCNSYVPIYERCGSCGAPVYNLDEIVI